MKPTQSNSDWSQPNPVLDIEMAFPGSVEHLLPAWEDLPEALRRGWHSDRWCKQAESWFFNGVDLKASTITPRDGIDATAAFRHLGVCLGSWEPKHEHKIAGVGYLMSLWFEELELVGASAAGGRS